MQNTNRKEWNSKFVNNEEYKKFLREVREGDAIVYKDEEYGNTVTFFWIEAFDRPQKRINDENGNFLKYELDYGE